ncbi:hypothetical protein NX868_11345 [Burkholderia thailandensis]|uniref:DUF3025 domain-containing protein n=1 Tax=Burkholderia thailandensis TaxID=57975 RepID=A0AAW9CQZ7_BURTH|nr:hypothetical protein [Burkholderia thailandensis]AHI67734.1 hypothetical protein BTL_5499 [Burkholderia thailandensis H0587]AOJ53024.1 hypothetical protein AQ475_19095 [Burkholderia thailandensis]AVR28862.1 hypothetical protein A8H32_29180 [Burkholderia thailandensis]MCS3392320.1 hypothetical protein [Burkholderia thailandensis]MCS6425397.1 hypothetical protein [Burkholderia thailandensis]
MSTTDLPQDMRVAPDSVRVWRGFRLPSLGLDQFMSKLGTVFVPATVKMQIDAGLRAYAPTVPAGLPGKPASVPDETAILFWASPATYWNGFARLAVRTYTLTHNGVYLTQDNQSRADFPVRFDGTLAVDQPVYLYDAPADWMRGAIRHLVAARPAAADPASFRSAIAKALADIQKNVPLAGALACTGNDYVVYWELGPVAAGAAQAPTGVPRLQAVLTDWHETFAPAPTFLPIGLWDEWAGMDVRSGSSFNMQFEREVSR